MRNKINFTAFDFETATYDKHPCQLGLIIVREGKIVDEIQYLIKPPQNKFDKGCINVHGIKPEDTIEAPEFYEIWDEIKVHFNHEVLVGHNCDFDIDVLYRVLNFYNLHPHKSIAEICTMNIFNGRSLKDVTTALNIEMDKHHDALSDARACAEVFLAYLSGVNPEELDYPKKERRPKRIIDEDFVNSRHLSSEVKQQDLSCVENKDNLFYDKRVVISGVFENFPVRNDLALILKKLGADINGSISKKTNIFIIGEDYGPSKMEKVESLIDNGVNIEIMKEDKLVLELNQIKCK